MRYVPLSCVLILSAVAAVSVAADIPPPNAVPLTPEVMDAITPKIPTKDGHPDAALLCIASDLYNTISTLSSLHGLIPLSQIELAAAPKAMLTLLRTPTESEIKALRAYRKLMTGCLQAQHEVTRQLGNASLNDTIDERDVLLALLALNDLTDGSSTYAAYTARVTLLRKSIGGR